MWSLDLADGSVLFSTRFGAQWENYLAPSLKDGYLYANGGAYGGMYALNAGNGASRWFANLAQYDLWTRAVDDKYAYAYTADAFAVLDRASGVITRTIQNPSFNSLGVSLIFHQYCPVTHRLWSWMESSIAHTPIT
ncbi:MAG: hypothetical protein WDO12_12310 [Pseudomonadota bacterium]